jgi:FkbM family methyltransferase
MPAASPHGTSAEQSLLRECARLLQPQRPMRVIDIGANSIDDDQPYRNLLRMGLCQLTAFDPQGETAGRTPDPNQTRLPWALGDGGVHTLHVCDYPGWTSLLRPSAQALESFPLYKPNAHVVRTETVQTRRLDYIEGLRPVDFIKIDVQGSEKMIFAHGGKTLDGAVAVQTEISFVPLYENQPTLGDIDLLLRAHGLIPCAFLAVKPHIRALIGNKAIGGVRQILEGDLLYLRDYTRPEIFSVEQLKQLALLLTALGLYDIALHMFELLEARGALPAGVSAQGFGTLLWEVRSILPTIDESL